MPKHLPHHFLAWLIAGLVLAPSLPDAQAASPAASAPAATGTITGRVQNVATGQYLHQARVSLKGTNQTVYTDTYGVFRLIEVRSGPVVLEVFYTDHLRHRHQWHTDSGKWRAADVGSGIHARRDWSRHHHEQRHQPADFSRFRPPCKSAAPSVSSSST